VNYKGNRIDIGGHRFFSKSDRVMQWWTAMLPTESREEPSLTIAYQQQRREIDTPAHGADPAETDEVLLVRSRKSRIFFLRRFFDYPLKMNLSTVANLGPIRMAKILASYLKARALPIRDEKNLEQFLINRFGRELYRTFFKSYTEKVWGVPCERISAEWGAQRIKGLSIGKALAHAARQCCKRARRGDVAQKETETSLIERFLYPKYGPGQMWETCAEKVRALGGEILMNTRVEEVHNDGERVSGVTAVDATSGERYTLYGDYVFSTMPVKELVRALDRGPTPEIREVSEGLIYRDFITVGLLVDELLIQEDHPDGTKLLKDNWIYIQEPDVQVGRLQIFNNWSPWMVADSRNVWLGMEYFCNETDAIWSWPDERLKAFGAGELAKLGFIREASVVDATVIRMPKTYPAYFGTYDRFDVLRGFFEGIENLFLIGRNGMHRYNNQDHSMLTAMTAVDNILAGRTDKANIWSVNTEHDYHEEVERRQAPPQREAAPREPVTARDERPRQQMAGVR
jgi:protoporphyrinogen oxidase